jgi:predicted alpha/beta superfamily hydrolase
MRSFFILFLIIFTNYTTVNAQENTPSKQLSSFTIDAPQLKTKQRIWVYLPKKYSSLKKKFPVIYINDAQNIFDVKTANAGEWNIEETLNKLKANAIVVGIESEIKKYDSSNSNAYLDFMTTTLKPYVDKNYRTKTASNNTAIFGSSIGGLIAYQAILQYPKVFGKAGIFSPSFADDKNIYEKMTGMGKIKTKIYLLCGDNESKDMVSDVNKMEYLLNVNRCHCLNLTKKVIVKGGQDNEKLWREGFEKAYLWLM